MRQKTALITGLEGFTGRYVAEELGAAGYKVVGISATAAPSSSQSIKCDIRDVRAVAEVVESIKPDVVCHLAAIAFVAHGDPAAMYGTNVVGTRNLLAALAESCEPQAVVLASSANIYGNAQAEVLDEQTTPAPANDYAVSKLAMEYMARLWVNRLPITVVRPFNYTGVGQSKQFLIPKIVDHFAKRAPVIELGNLGVIRDFSDVRNVARAYRLLVQTASTRASGEVFNLCSGFGYSLRDVISMMQEIAGYQIEERVNPAFVRADEVQKLIGTRSKLELAIGALPNTALRETLSWMYDDLVGTPTGTSLDILRPK